MTDWSLSSDTSLDALLEDIKACRICRDAPFAAPLPHEPRPVFQISRTARFALAGQAPGVRVHNSGKPFTDPSGDRLRHWLGIGPEIFYDPARVAIIPMGFCFPGHDSSKADLPPRTECRATWHDRLFALLPNLETIMLNGRYAQAYHFSRLGRSFDPRAPIGDIVRASLGDDGRKPRLIAVPHPSWRNSGWLKANPWFEQEVLPVLRAEVARLVAPPAPG